jgi:hypothetical protein
MARTIAGVLGIAALLLPTGTPVGIDRYAAAAATTGLVVLGGWAALLTTALVAARLPATAGAWGRRTARRLLPAALHGVLGLTVVGLLPASALGDSTAPSIQIDRVPHVSMSVSMPASPEPRDPAVTDPAPDVTKVHIVAPGESLWSIAATELPPGTGPAAIDTRWRQWWHHNRAAIGADPHLIHVGLHLAAPPETDSSPVPRSISTARKR